MVAATNREAQARQSCRVITLRCFGGRRRHWLRARRISSDARGDRPVRSTRLGRHYGTFALPNLICVGLSTQQFVPTNLLLLSYKKNLKTYNCRDERCLDKKREALCRPTTNGKKMSKKPQIAAQSISIDLSKALSDSHPYAVKTALDQEEAKRHKREKEPGQECDNIRFSNLVKIGVASYAPAMFLGSQGIIEETVRSNRFADYTLTIGTCGHLAPGWVMERYHKRPMWILHCPNLPVAHIEGCCFFEGIASNSLNARNYTRENDTVGISYLVWNLAKNDEVVAKVDAGLLNSLCDADSEGSVVIAYVGRDSCIVTCTEIPPGLVEFLIDYETIFEQNRYPIIDSERFSLQEAERSIHEELVRGFRPPAVCQVTVIY